MPNPIEPTYSFPESNKIYEFCYNPCVHDSGWITISLHYSKEGAEKAMEEHKLEEKNKFDEMFPEGSEFGIEFGEHENWCVNEVEILP